MSRLNVDALHSEDGGSSNIELDDSRNTTCKGNLTVDGTTTLTGAVTLPAGTTSDTLSFRNLMINGAMRVAQRGTSTTTEGAFLLDRWKVGWSGQDEAQTVAQHALTSSDTGPWAKGFRYSLHITNGNQSSGAGASDDTWIKYVMEDQDLCTSGWDYTDSNSKATLSFWVKASVAQTYYVILETRNGTSRQFSFDVPVSANTWTKITQVIPGDSSFQCDNDNGEGLHIYFVPFYGTGKTSSGHTIDSWHNTDGGDQCPDMTSTWWTTNDSTFEITGVQFEVGDTATEFEHRSYGDELARCERYYEVQRMNTGTGGYYAHSNAATGNTRYHNMSEFRCHKRASPTVTLVATANVNTPTLFPSSTHIGLYHQSGTFYLTCNHDTVVWTIDSEF